MTQVLTLKTVKRKAREAYKARRLTAQHRDHNKRVCAFEVGECHCAIGAALSKSTLKAVHAASRNRSSVSAIADQGLIKIDKDTDLTDLAVIQRKHDDWAVDSKGKGATSSAAQNRRRAFLKLIAA